MKIEETDTLIIGSGVAASLVASQLLAKGAEEVCMLEAGPPLKMKDRRLWLDYVMARRLPYDHLTDNPNEFVSDGAQPWQIPGGRLLARGGSTLHWGGWCPRMKPEDFHLTSNIGKGGLDWPFDYNYLEPYYVRAEHYLGVAGDSADHDPPRSAPYPFEAPPYTRADGKIITALEKLGLGYGHIPLARNGAPINGQPPCMTTGTCSYCPIGGRFTGDQPLDRLADNPRFTLRLNAPVTKILMDGKRQIHGVNYMDTLTGEIRRMDASRVILCAGALETPKLLLLSRSEHWPEGLGNHSDHVGRHLIANPYFFATGMREDNPDEVFEETWFATLGSRHWDTPAHQAEGKFFLNRGDAPNHAPENMMLDGLALPPHGPHGIALQGTMQTFSYAANRVLPAKGKTRFGLPRTHIEMPIPVLSDAQKATNLDRMKQIIEAMGYQVPKGPWSIGAYPQRGDHAMCSTRMSVSPADGVVDPDLRVHGTNNLYIVSNSVFPAGTPANPTLTLTALALRFTDKL